MHSLAEHRTGCGLVMPLAGADRTRQDDQHDEGARHGSEC